MEEIIEVQISGDIRKLSKKDFILIKELISFKEFQQSKIDLKLDQQSFRVLNIFMYYIIMIQKNIKFCQEKNNNVKSFSQSGQEYRQLCLREISDYYIKNHMNIQIYKFSVACSKILAIKLEQCAHIIYYLIYGRFASHQYINSLCNKKIYNQRKRHYSRNQKQSVQWQKRTRRSTVLFDKNQNMLKQFSQQLQKTLKSNTKISSWGTKQKHRQSKSKNEKYEARQSYFEHSTLNWNKNNQNQLVALVQERKVLNRGNTTSNFIPHRIGQKENSSILQNLSFCHRQSHTCTNWNKKGLMRKLKFNQSFDVNQIKFHNRYQTNVGNDKVKKELSEFVNKYARSTIQKMGKISYENFKNISKDLKIKQEASVRTQSRRTLTKMSSVLKKLQNHRQQQQNHLKSQMKAGEHQQFFSLFGNNTIDQVKINQNKQGKNVFVLKKSPTLFQDSTNLKQLNLQKFISYQTPLTMAKKQSYLSQKQQDSVKQQEHITNLLRNDINYKGSNDQKQTKKLNYFSQNSLSSMKKQLNGRLNLQKYKSDYRKFLKTQLLDRIRQAN